MSQQEPDVFTPFMRKVSALFRPVGLNGERFKQWADYTPLWVLIPGGVFSWRCSLLYWSVRYLRYGQKSGIRQGRPGKC